MSAAGNTTAHALAPILRPVTAEEAASLSPWPDRLSGKVAWSRPQRTAEDLQREYDDELYRELVDRWAAFIADIEPARRSVGHGMQFLNEVRRESCASILEHPEIYGETDLGSYLVSVGDRLYAADLACFEVFYRSVIAERIADIRSRFPFDVIVEAGCGTGVNLLTLGVNVSKLQLAGSDLSANAIEFLRRMSADVRLDASFEIGDLRDVPSLVALAPRDRSWALLTVHAAQMVEHIERRWFEALASLENRPQLGIHFEPAIWPEAGPFGRQCETYARMNRYNLHFLESLRTAEEAMLIDIVVAEPWLLGVSAFAPSSLIIWRPKV